MKKIECLVSRVYSINQCRTNPTTLFIYGDNGHRVGMSGQAIIREQENALGICTKHKPTNEPDAFFSDEQYEDNCKLITKDFKRIEEYIEEKGFKKICFPFQGLGTGRAQMLTKAPLTFCFLTEQLISCWQFNNLGALQSKEF